MVDELWRERQFLATVTATGTGTATVTAANGKSGTYRVRNGLTVTASDVVKVEFVGGSYIVAYKL